MIKLGFIVMLAFVQCGEGNEQRTSAADEAKATPVVSDSAGYGKQDLTKLKWIEGRWRGMYSNQPFYEIYRLLNDSTLEITSYDWNGNDSINTSRTYVRWSEGYYYLGNQKNWKVAGITDTAIVMKRNYKASNDIVWRYNNATSWDAYLESEKGTNHYHMEAFDPFRK